MRDKIIITTVILLIFILLFIPTGITITKAENKCVRLPIPFMSFFPCAHPNSAKCILPGSAMTFINATCPPKS